MPEILVINPNTSRQVSQNIDAMVRSEVGGAATVRTVTATFGYRYIASRAAAAIAAHAVLDTAAQAMVEGLVPDAIILACFGDPGLEALAEMTGLPVVGFAEAGILTAAAETGSFIIATKGDVWCEMLAELLRRLGLNQRVGGIHSIGKLGDDPSVIAAFLAEEARRVGASRIVVGGAGLISELPAIIAACPMPVIDPHRAAVRKALQRVGRSRSESSGATLGETTGLSVLLTDALARPKSVP